MGKKQDKNEDQKPVVMWKTSDKDKKGYVALCEYLPEKRKCRVTVSFKEHKFFQLFTPNFEPIFGLDVIDNQEAMKIADLLASKIDELLKS